MLMTLHNENQYSCSRSQAKEEPKNSFTLENDFYEFPCALRTSEAHVEGDKQSKGFSKPKNTRFEDGAKYFTWQMAVLSFGIGGASNLTKHGLPKTAPRKK